MKTFVSLPESIQECTVDQATPILLDMTEWISENTAGEFKFNLLPLGYYFEKEDDAVFFKLTWYD